MAEKRITFMRDFDHIRKLLLQEPRGYPCQNLNIIFPTANPEAEFGYVIAEQNKIYPLFSGHNTICVVTALLVSYKNISFSFFHRKNLIKNTRRLVWLL